jgi:hypothetical protein
MDTNHTTHVTHPSYHHGKTYKSIHCKKKVSDFPVPRLDVTIITNQTVPVSDIPAGDDKIVNLFYSEYTVLYLNASTFIVLEKIT